MPKLMQLAFKLSADSFMNTHSVFDLRVELELLQYYKHAYFDSLTRLL